MTRGLRVKLSARLDLLEHYEWLHVRSPQAAARFFDRVDELFEFLRRNPHAGRRWPDPPRRLRGVRCVRITGFERVLVFYKLERSTIVIARLIHGSMDMGSALAAIRR